MKKKLTIEELETIRRELTDQLIQSERIRSLGALSGGVAHRFNSLLSVILGYSSLILNREKVSREAKDALEKITEAAQCGRRLTEELLAFAGNEMEEDVPCRLHETLTSVLSLLQSQVHSRVQIETHLDASHDEIVAPPSSIHQIVFNLLTNALDSMPEGGRLTVTTANVDVDEDGGLHEYLRIEVADTGEGLPENFEPPDKEKSSAGDFTPSNSLAFRLSSVYGIVGKLDGTVVTSSEPGSPTRVEVLLPTTARKKASHEEEGQRRRLVPSTIWVVDDDAVFREMCTVVLSEQGHTIKELPGGTEMRECWNSTKSRPDLIIVDFSMPDYNGLELCQWLARNHSRVPVILVSGLSPTHTDISKALDMPRTYFLQKPFSFRELDDVVTVAMGETLIGE